MSSPRTWGCFWVPASAAPAERVFPTHVGVFPLPRCCRATTRSLPHARGGVSGQGQSAPGWHPSSLRTWGCFSPAAHRAGHRPVFPTHVGVFLPCGPSFPLRIGLPHARGGVSSSKHLVKDPGRSSPRTWGCFCRAGLLSCGGLVFPTHVGVFPRALCVPTSPTRLPHARGGVSTARSMRRSTTRSSPRTWGCFRICPPHKKSRRVFPTHVGVFLQRRGCRRPEHGLPHARGGVSWQGGSYWRLAPSSPRTWGCFLEPARSPRHGPVFPTHVGVFPAQA